MERLEQRKENRDKCMTDCACGIDMLLPRLVDKSSLLSPQKDHKISSGNRRPGFFLFPKFFYVIFPSNANMQMIDSHVPPDMSHYFKFVQFHHYRELQKQTGSHRQIFRSAFDMFLRNQKDIIGLDVLDRHCKFGFKIYRSRGSFSSDLTKDASWFFFESVKHIVFRVFTSRRGTQSWASGRVRKMPSQSRLPRLNRADQADRISTK